ncbi:hypothetical protein PoB_004004500 [Plakobranchus ocellatus]|uniref:Uncharacterized protein n=1 Tax=Plakobranchus ocellatus TaxID=259542 RepID=A0AAV4AYU2_9GAST|nr:hypothetical protein PoB_004004500 [Plakobranchus ocellatus]
MWKEKPLIAETHAFASRSKQMGQTGVQLVFLGPSGAPKPSVGVEGERQGKACEIRAVGSSSQCGLSLKHQPGSPSIHLTADGSRLLLWCSVAGSRVVAEVLASLLFLLHHVTRKRVRAPDKASSDERIITI